MTNELILKKAIEKAIENGWETNLYRNGEFTICCDSGPVIALKGLKDLLFDHDFAKAFWGEEPVNCAGRKLYGWECQLGHMVLEKDPIQYLAEYL